MTSIQMLPRHTLERTVLGSLGNLSCDNRFLQDAIVSSGGGQWIVRAAINGSARAMACNATVLRFGLGVGKHCILACRQ